MRENKFDIVVKNDVCINHKKYYLSEIVNGLHKLFDVENWEILAFRQFTGLHDRNGKEIYEGDIINREAYTKEGVAVVVRINDFCSFMWQSHENYKIGFTGGNADFFNVKTIKSNIGWEVIGNIHENSDLLK